MNIKQCSTVLSNIPYPSLFQSFTKQRHTHAEVKQCCWYSTYQTDSQIHWLVLGLLRNCRVGYMTSMQGWRNGKDVEGDSCGLF